VVVIPVSDVDRAKALYGSLGWRLDADIAAGDKFRVVQFTPPGSGCSVQFGTNLTSAAPGSAQGLYLIVSDIEAARAQLVGRGVEVNEIYYLGPDGRVSGPDPEHRSYSSYASAALLARRATGQLLGVRPSTTVWTTSAILPTHRRAAQRWSFGAFCWR